MKTLLPYNRRYKEFIFIKRGKRMNEKLINDIARQTGFKMASLIPTEALVFVPEYRKYCEQNDCGNFGTNYGCPPYCGTPKEMEERVKDYSQAIVFQSSTKVLDIFNEEETKAIKKEHTRMTIKVMKSLKENGLTMDGFPIMCGSCSYCEQCGMKDGTPCVNEEMCFSCLSAYCIDAGQMAERCGMEIQWSGDVVSFFSLYVFDKSN